MGDSGLMRILLTNDDGINAPGLAVLEDIAEEVAGPDGEVWVVAPETEQSGVGHCISYSSPTKLNKLGDRRYSVDGSPADCVLAALHEVLKDTPPDLVLSGVNRGNNAGDNTLYSGTVGGAMEAALQNYPAIALSQFYGPANRDLENQFEAAAETGAALVKNMLANAIWDEGGYRLFYNVNFPPVPAADVKGVKVTSQGFRDETYFSVSSQTSPTGRMFLWVEGGPQHHPTGPGTDVTANVEGFTSVTPMRADLTAYDVLDDLRKALE